MLRGGDLAEDFISNKLWCRQVGTVLEVSRTTISELKNSSNSTFATHDPLTWRSFVIEWHGKETREPDTCSLLNSTFATLKNSASAWSSLRKMRIPLAAGPHRRARQQELTF